MLTAPARFYVGKDKSFRFVMQLSCRSQGKNEPGSSVAGRDQLGSCGSRARSTSTRMTK